MSARCRDFRRRLERALMGRLDRDALEALGWQEHLLSCGECRDVLEAEQVLEELLASLPNPRLSPASLQRLVVRLQALRSDDAALDTLLDLDRAEEPPGLADRVLASVRARESVRLDEALDAWRVEVPVGLSERLLADLETSRHGRARHVPIFPWRYVAAAAALVVAAFAWRLWGGDAAPTDDVHVAQNGDGPRESATSADDELLANLDVLEAWDILLREDVDLLLASYDPIDEILLEWEAESTDEVSTPADDKDPEEG